MGSSLDSPHSGSIFNFWRVNAVVALIISAVFLCPQRSQAARLFTSGFETGDNLTTTEWDGANSVRLSQTVVHSGQYSVESSVAQTGDYATKLGAAKTSGTLFVRGYFRWNSFPGAEQVFMEDYNDVASQIGFRVWISGGQKIELQNWVTFSAVTSVTTLALNTWYRFEVRHLIASSGGALELRWYNNDSASPVETLTINNENTLPSNITYVLLGEPTFSVTRGDVYVDDVGVNDETGTFQSSWLGPGSIVLLKPSFNNSTAWTPNPAGSFNAQNTADEPGTPDDDTSYNSISDAQRHKKNSRWDEQIGQLTKPPFVVFYRLTT
jgi:hypothetical protein